MHRVLLAALLVGCQGPVGPRVPESEPRSSLDVGSRPHSPKQRTLYAAQQEGVVLSAVLPEEWLTTERRRLIQVLEAQRQRSLDGDFDEGAEEFVEDEELTLQDLVLPQEILDLVDEPFLVGRAPDQGRLPEPCRRTLVALELRSDATSSFESARTAMGFDRSHGVFLFGRFSDPCPDALWATVGWAPVAQYLPEPPDTELERRVAAAYESESVYREMQAEFERAEGRDGPWDGGDFGQRWIEVMGEKDAERLVFVAGSRGGGSDDFQGSLTMLFSLAPGTSALQALGVIDRDG